MSPRGGKGTEPLIATRRSWPTVRGWLALGGVALFAFLVYRVGLVAVGQLLLSLRWSAILVPLPQALAALAETLGWWFAFPREGCPLGYATLFRFTMAAKSIRGVTPSVSQAGEFVKFHLLRGGGVPADMAAASLVAAKTTIAIAELTFIAVGLVAVSLSSVAVDPGTAATAIVGLVALALVWGAVLACLRRGLFQPVLWLGRRLTILQSFVHRYEPLLSSTGAMLQEYVVQHRTRFFASGLAHFWVWLLGAFETWVFLWMLGIPVRPAEGLFVHLCLMVVTRLTAFVPSNLGTQEVGLLGAFAVVGLPAEGALAFAVLRRLRRLVWIGAGLAVPWGGRRLARASFGARS